MRVAVLSMAYGAGHRMAGQALAQALGDRGRHLILRHPSSEALYLWTQRNCHGCWALAYSLSEIFPGPARWLSGLIRSGFSELGSLEADLALATHFYPSLQMTKRLRTRVVITDWVPHPVWVAPGVERYYVASPETARLLARWVPEKLIRITGIPVRRIFWEPISRERARDTLEVHRDAKVVVVNAGAFGVTRIVPVVKALARAGVWVHVVAGRNSSLRLRLQELMKGLPGRVEGFVEDIHLLLSAADLIVTKAGGIITSECLASGLPMIFLGSMPGQERGNARVLSAMGVGVVARSPREAVEYSLGIVLDPGTLSRMRSRARRLGRPRAALEIARDVLGC